MQDLRLEGKKMFDKALFKISFWVSFKRAFQKSKLLLITLYFVLPIFIYFKDSSYETGLKTLMGITAFFFLFFAGDIINEDFNGGALENVLFVNGKYSLFLFYRPICNVIIATLIFIFHALVFFIIGILTNNSFVAFSQISRVLLFGVYWSLFASLLSYYIKGYLNSVSLFVVSLILLMSTYEFQEELSCVLSGSIENFKQLLIGLLYISFIPFHYICYLKYQIFIAIMIIILLIIHWEKSKNLKAGS